jgi:hypothetical protein
VASSGEFRYPFLAPKKHRKGFSERCIRTPGRALVDDGSRGNLGLMLKPLKATETLDSDQINFNGSPDRPIFTSKMLSGVKSDKSAESDKSKRHRFSHKNVFAEKFHSEFHIFENQGNRPFASQRELLKGAVIDMNDKGKLILHNSNVTGPRFKRRKSRPGNPEMCCLDGEFVSLPTFDTPDLIRKQLMEKEISMQDLAASLNAEARKGNFYMNNRVVENANKGFLFGDDNISGPIQEKKGPD